MKKKTGCVFVRHITGSQSQRAQKMPKVRERERVERGICQRLLEFLREKYSHVKIYIYKYNC